MKSLFTALFCLLLLASCEQEEQVTPNSKTSDSSTTEQKGTLALTVPTLFTPNGDGVNDVLFIRNFPGSPTNPLKMTVYNSAKSQVYQVENYLNNYNGKGQPDGVYTFTLEGKDGKQEGTFTIIRQAGNTCLKNYVVTTPEDKVIIDSCK